MRINKFIIYLILPLFFNSCIGEENISTSGVKLISPLENHVYSSYTSTFWWQKVEGAIEYNVQIVEGSFEMPVTLLADTNISNDKFTWTLYPGNFQWRVKAFNGSTETSYSTRNLIIDSSSIASQKIILSTPANESVYFKFDVNFNWQPLYGSNAYRIQIDTLNGTFNGSMILDTTIIGTSSTTLNKLINNKTGSFNWKVQAYDGASYSQFSDVGKFVINNTPPVLTLPNNNATNVPETAQITWQPLNGASQYKLYLRDSVGSPLIPDFPKIINGTSYDYSGESGNKIYWTVAGVDARGNNSDTLRSRMFQIQKF